MIDMIKAKIAFANYVAHYDAHVPSIKLKIVHTYEVIKCSDYLCDHLGLNEEDKQLAGLIALLHDIGRFEQWKQYQSFADHKTVDHALFSSELLFEQGLIREFVEDRQYDILIKYAIEQHNKYHIDDGFDDRTLLFIHLIRDADKLDNFRVKETEKIEDILFATTEDVNASLISPLVYEQMAHQELVYAPNRQTLLDMWLSYIAFIYDLHFDVSLHYIKDQRWISRSFDRFEPIDLKTHEQYLFLKQKAFEYIERKIKDES